MTYYLGVDFGTSGARAIAIDETSNIVKEINYNFETLDVNNLALIWQQTLFNLIQQIPVDIKAKIKAIAINGTSATVLLCDSQGNPITEPLLYNDNRGQIVLDKIQAKAPTNHLVITSSSSLAKLLWWQQQPIYNEAAYFLHQADWLGFLLHRKLGISDYHNALKLGYDVQNLKYPDWLISLVNQQILPQVLAPGTVIKEVRKDIANSLDLNPKCLISTGTTDSIAAFLASGVNTPGEAVTSLGSTLVLKLLSTNFVEDTRYGIYSHRLGDLWLTGGASNTGGAVLKNFFTDTELVNLSSQIDPNQASVLEYYPLIKPGDRFPINDPNLQPKLEPRPQEAKEFLHGLLESMARIEAKGYQLLETLGATALTKVYTAGGGANNETWRIIRQRHLQVPVKLSPQIQAAYGTALLAKQAIKML